MPLTGAQIQQIQEALLDSYPSKTLLEMMVRVQLDEVLEAVAYGENLRVIIFNLVTWAERTGRIDDLVGGAYRQTPGNPALLRLVQLGLGGSVSGETDLFETDYSSSNLTSGPSSIDVFLSYSRNDNDAKVLILETLRSAGLSVWTDDGLEPGTTGWREAISEAVGQAQVMVVLLSPRAKASTWVNNEIAYANTLRKRILPLLISGNEAESVPIDLINIQWVDARVDLRNTVHKKLLPSLIPPKEVSNSSPPLDVRHTSEPQAHESKGRGRENGQLLGSRKHRRLAFWFGAAAVAGITILLGLAVVRNSNLLLFPLSFRFPLFNSPAVSPMVTISTLATEAKEFDRDAVVVDNCSGTSWMQQELSRSSVIVHELEFGDEFTIGPNGWVHVLKTDVNLGAYVAAQLGVEVGTQTDTSRSVVVAASPGTRTLNQIAMRHLYLNGNANVQVGENAQSLPFKLLQDFDVTVLSSEVLPCPEAAATKSEVSSLLYTLGTAEQCSADNSGFYFVGEVRDSKGEPLNDVCVHLALSEPVSTTKCSGCDGLGDGAWGFSPFKGLAPTGTKVEIYIVGCPGLVPQGGLTENTGSGDLTPLSPKWERDVGQTVQCTGITFYRK